MLFTFSKKKTNEDGVGKGSDGGRQHGSKVEGRKEAQDFSQGLPVNSVPREKLPNVHKSCPKMISIEKLKILAPAQKLPKLWEIWSN